MKTFILMLLVALSSHAYAQYAKHYTVLAKEAHFYDKPDETSPRRIAYLVEGEKVNTLKGQDGFIYTEFTNKRGVVTKGWLVLADLIADSTLNEYKHPKYVYQSSKNVTAPVESKIPSPPKHINLPKAVLKEFAVQAKYTYKYGSDNFKAFLYRSFSNKELPEIAVMIEGLDKNLKDEYEVIEAFWRFCGNSRNFLFANLNSIGLSANTAKIITDYLIEEHSS